MSSHREAPEIAKDPVADSTDVYAFVSPDKPDTVTIIANYIPLQQPDGGPNFYEFGDDVRYEIHISNDKDAKAEITYRFDFTTRIRNPKTFLYNTGQIKNVTDQTWNRPQYFTVTRIEKGRARVLARNLTVPPVNVGKRSTPDYAKLSAQAVHKIGNRSFFAGQRADAFHVDLGSIFDLGGLRPLNQAHLIKLPEMGGVNSVQSYNVHSIAIQVPISDLTRYHDRPTDPLAPQSVIGVWTTAGRRQSQMYNKRTGTYRGHGPFRQVSRLGNPLFNEVIVPMAEKDKWNSRKPGDDRVYAKYVNKPELGGLIPALYPGAFPNLAKYKKPRADLNAILLTGIPKGIVAGFQNYTGRHRGGHAAPQRGDQADRQAERPRRGGRRPGRVPQRTPHQRRRRDDRAARDRRCDDPAGGPVVRAGRRRRRGLGRYDEHERRRHREVPLPGSPGWRVPDGARHHAGVMTAPAQVENPFAGQGSVLLDIGGDVGALVVTMPADMVDVEVEIRPVGSQQHPHGHGHHHDQHHDHDHDHGGHHPHVAVVARPIPGGAVPSLVFPELVEGSYELYVKTTDDVRLTVSVAGGEVSTADWPR